MRNKLEKLKSSAILAYQQLIKFFHKVKSIFHELKQMKKESDIQEVDLEYMTDTSAAMRQGIPIVYHFILIAAAVFLLVALIWANFATLDVVTVAQGKVIPSRNMQVIQSLDGGIVKEIHVKVGQVVQPKEVLMVIDDTRFTSALKEGEVQTASLKAKIERLTAETHGADLTFPKSLEEQYPQVVNQERSLYESRKKELQVKLNILKDEVSQHNQELIGMREKKEQLQRSLDLVTRELKMTKPLLQQGAVSEVDILRLERTVNELNGDLQQTEISIPKLEATLGGAQKKLEELQLTFRTDAQADLNT
ncbi:MAG: biotin/lipoyl-binding protein, partial [Candidatus Berkiellales bacterium]